MKFMKVPVEVTPTEYGDLGDISGTGIESYRYLIPQIIVGVEPIVRTDYNIERNKCRVMITTGEKFVCKLSPERFIEALTNIINGVPLDTNRGS